MKKKLLMGSAMALLLLSVVVFMTSGLFAASKPSAQVTFLEGAAKAKMGATGDWKPVKKGAKLFKDHVLKTEKSCRVELTLPDGSVLRVAPKSRVRLKSLLHTGKKKDGTMNFKISAGKVWANVSKTIGDEKKFEITTHNAVAGVRGTVFRVDALASEATVVKVYSGAVAVSNAPIYQKKEQTGKRRQVPGPKQVTKKQWEELVAKAMQEVRVEADGRMAQSDFTAEDDNDEWVAWNREMDKKQAE